MKQLIKNVPPIEVEYSDDHYSGYKEFTVGNWGCDFTFIVIQYRETDPGDYFNPPEIHVTADPTVIIMNLCIYKNETEVPKDYVDRKDIEKLMDNIHERILDNYERI